MFFLEFSCFFYDPTDVDNLISVWFLCLLFFQILFYFYFTMLYWFCHTSTWILHGCTRVPNPEPLSHLPPHTISLGHPSAPAPSILSPASNPDWRFISYTILYILQCHSPKSSHPLSLPQSPKDCSIHLCLFCCTTDFYMLFLYSISQLNFLMNSVCFGVLSSGLSCHIMILSYHDIKYHVIYYQWKF